MAPHETAHRPSGFWTAGGGACPGRGLEASEASWASSPGQRAGVALLAALLVLPNTGCRSDCAEPCDERGDSSGSDSRGPGDTANSRDSGVETGRPDSGGADTGLESGELDTGGDGDTDTGGGGDSGGGPTYVVFDLDDADVKVVGNEADSSSAGAVAVGDFNGDGAVDLLLGKEYSNVGVTSGGAAYVMNGPVDVDRSVDDADLRLAGAEFAGHAATAVACAGDVDGDGIEDMLIGAPGPVGWDSPGRAYLVSGGSIGEHSLAAATAELEGEYIDTDTGSYDYGYAGASLSGAGDADGDGYDDLLIGAERYDRGWGVAYLVHGPVSGAYSLADADVRIEGESRGDGLGGAVRSGDANGDGTSDVFLSQVAEPRGALTVYAAPHPESRTPADADATFLDSSGNLAGGLLDLAGDTNGDGYEDYWLAAALDDRGGTNAGGVYLLPGPFVGAVDESSVSAILLGSTAGEYAGVSLAALGDVNGDGSDDILVGTSPGSGYTGGSSYLVYGPFGGTTSLLDSAFKFTGDGDDQAGWEVAAPGDVDGDGLADLLISGPGDDDGGAGSGAAWIVFASSL